MKNVTLSLLVLTLLIVLQACSQNTDSAANSNEKVSDLNYTYNADSTYVGFVAYKFNEKVGVPGWFKQFSSTGVPKEINSAQDLMENLEFKIPVTSLETGIEDRNAKIIEHFFGTISTDTLSGSVLKLEGTQNEGKAIIQIAMNGLTKDAELDYSLIDNVFQLKGTIDVEIWDALSGINSLNKVCEILHQGTDGVSKLWSTVDIDIKTTLVSN
jgi:hypothetical protein